MDSLGTMSNASHSGSFSASRGLGFGCVVILRSAEPGNAGPTSRGRLPVLVVVRNPLLVDHSVELIAHPPGLRLSLDLVAVDHSAAIGIGANAVTARHRTRRVVAARRHYLKRADAAGCLAVSLPRRGSSRMPVPSDAPAASSARAARAPPQ